MMGSSFALAMKRAGLVEYWPAFVKRCSVEAALARHGLPAQLIEIELTESILLQLALPRRVTN